LGVDAVQEVKAFEDAFGGGPPSRSRGAVEAIGHPPDEAGPLGIPGAEAIGLRRPGVLPALVDDLGPGDALEADALLLNDLMPRIALRGVFEFRLRRQGGTPLDRDDAAEVF